VQVAGEHRVDAVVAEQRVQAIPEGHIAEVLVGVLLELLHAALLIEIYPLPASRPVFALKLYPPETPAPDIRRINRVLTFLDEQAFPALPGYYLDQHHRFVGRIGRRPALLRPWFNRGKMPRIPQHYAMLGARIATLHRLPLAPGLPIIPETDTPEIRRRMTAMAVTLSDPDEYHRLLHTIPPLQNAARCLIHNDAGPHNTLVRNDGAPVLIDWDQSGIGPRIHDLAFPLIWMFIGADCDLRDANARAYYSAYADTAGPDHALPATDKSRIFSLALFFALKYLFYRNPAVNVARIRTALHARRRLEEWIAPL